MDRLFEISIPSPLFCLLLVDPRWERDYNDQHWPIVYNPFLFLDILDQVLASHFGGLRQAHDSQASWRNVGQTTLVSSDIELTLVTRDDERYRVGSVSRVRGTSFRVDHLFGVTVVGGDGEDVACFLTRVVDRSNRLVGGSDGLDGGIEVTGVTNL
jgi:hypothetical protein